jgi:hypothetical protein
MFIHTPRIDELPEATRKSQLTAPGGVTPWPFDAVAKHTTAVFRFINIQILQHSGSGRGTQQHTNPQIRVFVNICHKVS